MRAAPYLAAALLAASLTACGGAAAQPATSGIKLTLTEFKYSSPTIELNAGEKTSIELKNAGTVEHDFVIDAAGVKVSIQPGNTATRNLGPLSAGTYEIYCSVPGHKEAGMVGTLVVR